MRRQVVVGRWWWKDQVHTAVASRAHGIGVLLKKGEQARRVHFVLIESLVSRVCSITRGERERENDNYSIFYWEYISDPATIIPMIQMRVF